MSFKYHPFTHSMVRLIILCFCATSELVPLRRKEGKKGGRREGNKAGRERTPSVDMWANGLTSLKFLHLENDDTDEYIPTHCGATKSGYGAACSVSSRSFVFIFNICARAYVFRCTDV